MALDESSFFQEFYGKRFSGVDPVGLLHMGSVLVVWIL